MASQASDQDIIQEAYAERLKAIFDNYVSVAPSDPDGAKAKFVQGVTFLRSLRSEALQLLPKEDGASASAPPPAVSAKSAARKKSTS